MDLRLVRKLSVLSAIWSALFLGTLLTHAISHSVSGYAWAVYSLLVGASFVALKLWNKTVQEPVLDVNLSPTETSTSVVLAALVSLFGGALLQLERLQGAWTILLIALVMTASQFTLVKSTQPDPASPTHGFNRVVLLSRPIYFCLLSLLILLGETYTATTNSDPYTDQRRPSLVFYSFDVFDKSVIESVGSASLGLILSFPIIFLLGLLPQITTFIIYSLEQVDIHFFGSTAATLGIRSAAYSFLRSLMAITLLYLIALEAIGNQKLFSLFCGLLVSLAYLLSRNSSDATIAYRIFERFLRSLNPAKNPATRGVEKIELKEMPPGPSGLRCEPASNVANASSVALAPTTTASASSAVDETIGAAPSARETGPVPGEPTPSAGAAGAASSSSTTTTTTTTTTSSSSSSSSSSPSSASTSAAASKTTDASSAPSTPSPTASTTASNTSEANDDEPTNPMISQQGASSSINVSTLHDASHEQPNTSDTPAVVARSTPGRERSQDGRPRDNGTILGHDEIRSAAPESTHIIITNSGDNNNNNNQSINGGAVAATGAGDPPLPESATSTLDRDDRNSDTQSISTRIQATIDDVCLARIKQDLIRCLCTTILVFAIHITTVFTAHHRLIEKSFGLLAVGWGFVFHFVIPQLRRDIPCMCLAKPVLRPKEYNYFEVKTSAKLMWFEKLHYVAMGLEKNLIYPIFWLNCITHDSQTIKELYGQHVGSLILVIVSFKLIRSSFNDSSPNYITIVFAYLFFNYDVAHKHHCIFTINYFLFSIVHLKIHELLMKLQFIYIYIAPWQIPWGSAFHAFAQPFSVPHSALLFFQAILSSILSAPLQPILGSAIFMMSYVRPTKFWERDYNTNVIDINSTRLVTQLERNRIDSNRLDGIFYEHLTKCLQRKLCRDLAYGRWGPVSQGDCFIMASDNLNCLVHIIELGNGVCTFQLRGLEFRGTYCQQQEVEAITEGVPQDDGFCCCEPGRLPFFLSANAAFRQLWLAWHVTHTRYVLEGYSIADNAAGPMLQPFDLRRALITYYVKAIIYFTITSNQLARWLKTREFHEALEHTKDKMYADLDPTFSLSLDLDFDMRLCGVTRAKFCSVYFDWIKYCVDRVKSDKKEAHRAKLIAQLDCSPDSFLVSLCFGLSLLARRSLSAAANGQQFHTVESLLFGLHALLKGDFRVTSLHDEWIFQEMRFFQLVVIPGVRMALKLHQDHFAAPDDYDDNMVLYEAIAGYQKNLVISHETDVAWRAAVLSGVPSLLTLRLNTDDASNQYKFIMLNRRYLSFRIIKINRECVRGLWASQQQELIYFRNTDPERGSIQNAKQALRNMINSSCDQPVGYPIYVSPLTTSYFECGKLSGFP